MQNFQFTQIFTERRKELRVMQEQIANYVGISNPLFSVLQDNAQFKIMMTNLQHQFQLEGEF